MRIGLIRAGACVCMAISTRNPTFAVQVGRLGQWLLHRDIYPSLAYGPTGQQNQARNLTSESYVVQQANQNVTFDRVDNHVAPSGLNGGLIAAAGGAQHLTYPGEATSEGDFDAFIQIQNTTSPSSGYLLPGNGTDSIQALNIYATGTNSGNASAYFVPTADILRMTKIWSPSVGILNSFALPYTSWMNMPTVYANRLRSHPRLPLPLPNHHPEQVTANYMDFIYAIYPLGSFDIRPLNSSDVSATLSIRKFLLQKILETYPKRKFVLIADTSNSDVTKDYPEMATDFPGQVQCIFLRNTSSTDPTDEFPYDTKRLQESEPEHVYVLQCPG